MAIVFGLLFSATGVWLIVKWFGDFEVVFKGLIPLMLIGAGVAGILVGITNLTDAMKAKKEKASESKPEDK